jgi:hypothetical protein
MPPSVAIHDPLDQFIAEAVRCFALSVLAALGHLSHRERQVGAMSSALGKGAYVVCI